MGSVVVYFFAFHRVVRPDIEENLTIMYLLSAIYPARIPFLSLGIEKGNSSHDGQKDI